jgi:plasmid stabilization system protein ParE
MKGIRVSFAAEQDLDQIWYYIATNSQRADSASEVIDAITRAFVLFAHTPKAGAPRDEIDAGVRAFPVGSYMNYYREAGAYVIISRVLHGMRDQKTAYRETGV